MCDTRKGKDSSWNAYEREPPSFIARYNQGQNVHLEDELCLEDLLLLQEAFNNHVPSAVVSGAAGGVVEPVHRVQRPGRGLTRHEGKMSLEEFQAALRALLGSERWDSQTELLFNKVDASCNGYVDWDKLCSYLLLQHREKEFMAQPQDSVLSSQPLVRHCVHNKQETTTRVLAVTHPLPLRFFSVSKEGTLTLWDSNLDILRSHEVPGDSSKSHGNRSKFRMWTTDAVYMPNIHKIAVTTTSRDIHFFDVSTANCLEEFHLFGIKNVPTSLCYWYDEKSPGHRSVLLWGDDSGSVSLLWFLHPQKGMFETTFSNNNRPQKIFMHDICEHSRLASYQMAHRIHEDPVNRVFCDPHADLLITSSTSATTSVVIMDMSFKKKCYVWKINKGVTCFDFCKPLSLLVTAGMDPAVRLWNQYVTSRPMATLHGHCTTVLDVVIYRAMGQIFSYSKDAVLKVWDVQSQSCLRTLLLKFPCVQAGCPLEHGSFPFLLLSAAPHMLLVSCRDYLGLLRLDHGDSGRAGCLTHSAAISSALYNPILKQVATGCEDSTVCLWDVATGAKCLQLSNVHGKEEITCMNFDLSHRRLITGARNGTIKVWNVINGQNLHKLEAVAEAEVTGVICLPDNKLLAVGWSQQITQYNITDPNIVYVQADLSWKSGQLHKEDILAVDLCSARGLLATASFDGQIIIWTLDTQRPLLHIHRASSIRACCGRPKGTGGDTGAKSARSWPSAWHRNKRCCEEGVQPPVDKLLFLQQRARGGQWRTGALLVSSEAGNLCWWSIDGPKHKHGCFYAPRTADESVLGLSSDQDNRLLVSGDTAGSIQVWDISQFGLGAEKQQSSADQPPLLHCWRAHDSTMVSVELLTFNEQLFLLSASTDQTARLWSWDGQYVGFFGQDQKWNLHNPTTYQHPRDPWGNRRVATEEAGSASRQPHGSEDQGPGKASAAGESHGSGTQTSSPPKHEMTLEGSINPLGDSHQTANKMTALRLQVSQDLEKKRAARQERYLAFGNIDTGKMSRASGVCAPFQALAMQECKEFQLPGDLPMSTWMLRQGLKCVVETGLGSSPPSACSSSTDQAEDVI